MNGPISGSSDVNKSLDVSKILGTDTQSTQVEQTKGHSTVDTMGASAKQMTADVIPTDPGKPLLVVPTDVADAERMMKETKDVMDGNPWMAGTSLGKTLINYADILAVYAENKRINNESELTTMQETMEWDKMSAAIGKMNSDSRANEELVKGISSFGMAGVSFIEFSKTMTSEAKANEAYEEKVSELDNKIEAKKMEIADNRMVPDTALTDTEIETYNADRNSDVPRGQTITKASDLNYKQVIEFKEKHPFEASQAMMDGTDYDMKEMAAQNSDGQIAKLKQDQTDWLESPDGKAALEGNEELKTLIDQKADYVKGKETTIARKKEEIDRNGAIISQMANKVIEGFVSSILYVMKSEQSVQEFQKALIDAQAKMLSKLEQSEQSGVRDADQIFNQIVQMMSQSADPWNRLTRLSAGAA